MSDPRAIEADLEQTRERLASTIDQLVYRAKPSTVASRESARFKAFFVDPASGEPRRENIAMVAGGITGAVVLLVVLRKLTRN